MIRQFVGQTVFDYIVWINNFRIKVYGLTMVGSNYMGQTLLDEIVWVTRFGVKLYASNVKRFHKPN